MSHRLVPIVCLAFSGLSALFYQVVWVRLLGLAFGTTTEAIGTVLAVFFGGLALGNLLAARSLHRARRPLRVYAALEAAIALFALGSLPLLRRLDAIHAWLGADAEPLLASAVRLGVALAVLLPPTVAMGATVPVIARGVVGEDRTRGRSSAHLYAANTFGAVLGAYLCGFWAIPLLGLSRTVVAAAGANLLAAGLAAGLGWRGRTAPSAEASADAPSPPPAPSAPAPSGPPVLGRGERGWFLACFGLSGFVAIGYEIVWARVFGIVMEGTLYGFAAVLASVLLGIAVGSLAIARHVDRLPDLRRTFGLLHAAIALLVTLSTLALPALPHAHRRLAQGLGGSDALHPLFLLTLPIVLVPNALFGAAFPVLVRLWTRSAAQVGSGMGIATAVNTAGSIAASLAVSFWALPTFGADATLLALIGLEMAMALAVLLVLAPGPARGGRLRAAAPAAVLLAVLPLSYGGVHVEQAVAGRSLPAASWREYREALAQRTRTLELVQEGRAAVVTVERSEHGRQLRTNGLPESGVSFAPPYYSLETALLGVLPVLAAEHPRRALVIGLGGGNTVLALRHTELERIDVVELEPRVVDAVRTLHAGRPDPLDDPRVDVRIGDGRNALARGRFGRARYDVIASQPSHPWVQGAANLFTEEFFALARENLSEGGVLGVWVNAFRTDRDALLAIVSSFARVFPDAFVVNGAGDPSRAHLLLVGRRGGLRLDPTRMASALAAPALRDHLALFGIDGVEAMAALFEAPAAAFAGLAPGLRNTDDNAFVEMRIPRRARWSVLDFAALEAELAPSTPVLPPLAAPLDVGRVARVLLAARPDTAGHSFASKVERLLRVHGAGLGPVVRETLAAEAALAVPARAARARARLAELARAHPDRPEPLRALGLALASRERDFPAAAQAFAAAWQRSHDPHDAYDAARALYYVDRDAAWQWIARIPAGARARFPRLAFYEAVRALEQGAPRERLQDHLARVEALRETPEGRRTPGLDGLLARLALAVGDTQAIRRWTDLDAAARARRAAPLVARAAQALEAGRPAEAERALAGAAQWTPTDPRIHRLRARVALARGDRAGMEQALAELRRLAPSLAAGVADENRFRAEHGLPLLPPRPAEQLASLRPAARP